MIITYLVFGDKLQFYQEAVFSILSFLPETKKNDKIVVLTDAPQYFNIVKENITIVLTDPETLREWKGKHDFFWRIKIKAIQMVADMFMGDPVLYLDSDTFLFGSLDKIRHDLEEGNNLMHTNEGKLSKMHAKTTRIMWRQIRGSSYGGIEIDSSKCMWNAGVVGIGIQNKKLIDSALRICDEMCRDKVKPRLIEQFALSLALNDSNELKAAETEIGHYWGNKKKWNEIINELLIENRLKDQTTDQIIRQVQKMDFTQIPVQLKVSNTRQRLEKLIRKIFPQKRKLYITKA